MRRRQRRVDLAEQHAGVVGLVHEGAGAALPGQAEAVLQQRQQAPAFAVRIDRRIVEGGLRLLALLLVLIVGEEEERLVALDRSAERSAELVLAEVLVLGAVRVLAEQRAVAAEIEGGALVPVGAALGHHVDEAADRAAELGRGAVGDDLELLHRLEADDVLGPLTAALLAEERVVGVGAVDHHVVVDAALAADADLGAVRSLDDADGRRQLDEVDEVAAVDRQLGHRLFVDQRGLLRTRRLDHRRAALRR